MEFTTVYMLFLLTVIAVAIVVLTVFQGRTTFKVKKLGKEIKQLKKDLRQFRNEISNKESNQKLKGEAKSQITPAAKKKIEQVKQKIKATDFEWYIGGSFYSTIGVALLSIGLALFVKYAFDKQWINDIGRVSVAVLTGGVLFAIAQVLNNRYRMFGSVLVGGGISILFFAYALAYYQYQLFDMSMALVVFVLVTAFAVFLSVSYNRQELALLTTVSGFTAPFIAGVEFSDYMQLFTYILILDIALLIVAYFKKWMLIYITAFAFTGVFYGNWIIQEFVPSTQPPFWSAFIFLTIFFFIFLLIGTINNIRNKEEFKPFELSVIISLTVIYYSAGLVIISQTNDAFKGLFTALIAVINFLYLGILIRNKNIDKGLLYLLFGLGLVFTVLIPPVQLVGKTVTLVWSVQTVLILWLSQKLDVILMRMGAILLTLALTVSVTMDMIKIYYAAIELTEPLKMFLNIGFFTNTMATGTFLISFYLLGREKKKYFVPLIKVSALRGLLAIVGVVSLYMTFYLELKYHLLQVKYYTEVIDFMTGTYNIIFIAIPVLATTFIKQTRIKLLSGLLVLAAAGLYIFIYHIDLLKIREIFITTVQFDGSNYYFHYLTSFVLISIALAGCINAMKAAADYPVTATVMLWFSAAFIVFMVSSELDNILLIKKYSETRVASQISAENYATPYTLLWCTTALIYMLLSVVFRWKKFRYFTLAFMFFTLLKFFIYDFRQINQKQQIISFTVLGITLLIIAFLDQRVKLKAVSQEVE